MGVQGQPKKSLKEIIAEEYRKCALDPIYFMKKYCIIQHPVRGKIPFHLFPFQEDCLTDFKDNRLMFGKNYIYDDNGILKRIEIYKNGGYVGDAQIED